MPRNDTSLSSMRPSSHMALFALGLLGLAWVIGCSGGNSSSASRPAYQGLMGKPRLVGKWRCDIVKGLQLELTFRRTGQVMTTNALTGGQNTTFVITDVQGKVVILRHIMEAQDNRATEGKIEFIDEDTIKLWPPSSFAQLTETTYMLTRVDGTSPTLGEPIELPSEANRLLGAWEHHIQPPLGPKVQIDYQPDGAMYQTMFNDHNNLGLLSMGMGSMGFQEQTGQWSFQKIDGEALILNSKDPDGNSVEMKIAFPDDDHIVITSTDGNGQSQTFTRIQRLIE